MQSLAFNIETFYQKHMFEMKLSEYFVSIFSIWIATFKIMRVFSRTMIVQLNHTEVQSRLDIFDPSYF